MTKILYVEDNADNIYMLTRRLKKKGFDIIVAGDGQEAYCRHQNSRWICD